VQAEDSVGIRSFFASSLLWNVALGAAFIAVPLHAREVGLADAQIGLLLALPVILQLCLSLAAGALADQLGGKMIAALACLLTALGSIAFWLAETFISLLFAQLVLVLGRATFWPATWALASKLPGDKLAHLGRMNACTNAGQILGTSASGLILAWLSFGGAFISMSVMAMLALWLNQRVRIVETPSGKGFGATMASYPILLRDRRLLRSIACGAVSALPIALSFSFFPILLTAQGYAVAIAGILIALRPIGSISGSLLAARLRRALRHRLTPCVAAIAVGLAIALSASGLAPHYVALSMLVLGLASSLLSVFVQMEVTDATPLEMRGAAMALINVGWALCLLCVPMSMGWLSQWLGMPSGFYVIAVLAIAVGLVFGWRSSAALSVTAA